MRSIKRGNNLWFLLGICFLYAIYSIHIITVALFGQHNRSKDVSGEAEKRNYEAFFLSYWASYIGRNPLKAKDRNGFAEMGFRTEMYAHLLRNSDITDFEYLEKLLWSFCPGIKELRQQHLQRTRNERGIVVSAGKKNWIFLNHFISQARNVYKSDLIIEVHFYGEQDLPKWMRQYIIESFDNIRFVDLSESPLLDHTQLQMIDQGYALKPLAALMTPLSEFLLVDADTVFLIQPELFFESERYKNTGTLFFHDRHHQREGTSEIIHEFLSDQLSLRMPSEVLARSRFWKERGIYQQESGLVVFDKRRIDIFACLLYTVWQNVGQVRDQTTYRIFWGDKESFWLSFELSQKNYSFAESYAGGIGHLLEGEKEVFCSEHPLHFLDDAPVLKNETNHGRKGRPAWFNGSLLHDKRLNNSTFIDPTIWAMDGDWKFSPSEENWCLENYTRQSLDQYGLKTLLVDLIEASKAVNEKARKALYHNIVL